MKAVVYRGARDLGIEDREPAPPGPGQVRIDVAYTGICGTDLHIYHGDMDARVGDSTIIGHEMSGRIGSDWPVCLLASSYARWVEVLAQLLGDHDEADPASIWGDTARRVYGLEGS